MTKPDDVSKYGEPWAHTTYAQDNSGNVLRRDGVYGTPVLTQFVNTEDDCPYMERAEACVNALTGLDPTKLADLIKACRYINNSGIGQPCFEDKLAHLQNAYRALKETP